MSRLSYTEREKRVVEAFAAQYEADGKPAMARMFRNGGMDYSAILAALAFAGEEIERNVDWREGCERHG